MLEATLSGGLVILPLSESYISSGNLDFHLRKCTSEASSYDLLRRESMLRAAFDQFPRRTP
jgi:hypothetical protein